MHLKLQRRDTDSVEKMPNGNIRQDVPEEWERHPKNHLLQPNHSSVGRTPHSGQLPPTVVIAAEPEDQQWLNQYLHTKTVQMTDAATRRSHSLIIPNGEDAAEVDALGGLDFQK